jgi:hypothetical protein
LNFPKNEPDETSSIILEKPQKSQRSTHRSIPLSAKVVSQKIEE